MTWLPWWAGALALSFVCVLHLIWLGRLLGVSGRVTALVDRVRRRLVPLDPTDEQLMAELQAATCAEFGDDAAEDEDDEPAPRAAPAPFTVPQHALFFIGLLAGGALSAVAAHALQPQWSLRGELFARLLPGSAGPLALVGGGVLVGFGTRMAGGCTSGHGLAGVSRFQPGSLVSTAAFFASGVGTAFLLELLGGGR